MPRAVRGTMIGYGHTVSNQQGWRILLDTEGTVATTTDVSFDKSLTQSIASRSPSLISNDTIVLESTASPASSPDLPNSLKPVTNRPVTRSSSRITTPHSADPSPTTVPSAPVLPPVKLEPRPNPEVPDIVKPELSPDTPATQTATAITHRRPVGRPPRGQRWDPYAGKYVPTLSAPCLPSIAKVWSLVAHKVPPGTPYDLLRGYLWSRRSLLDQSHRG